ncbi:DUF2491 family protein [Vibrio cholerae]|nr:DUF2491 family protein [Vibrio cholerae]EGR0509222.1 DUF2491 family protein [Vibrio cholerae]
MFKRLKKLFEGGLTPLTSPPEKPQLPQVLGLHLGGTFTLDAIKLRSLESSLIIEGVTSEQRIEAVGVVDLDERRKIVRYYTDDDGFLQIQLEDNEIIEIILWYFYDTKGVLDADWQPLLRDKVAIGQYEIEGHQFTQTFEGKKPEVITEKTYFKNGTESETDQFFMPYIREIDSHHANVELLLVCAEEKRNKVSGKLEHELVISTGVHLNPIDIKNN